MKLDVSFFHYSDTVFAEKADAILVALDDRAKFPAVTPALPTVAAFVHTLRAAIAFEGPGRAAAIQTARSSLAFILGTLAHNLLTTPGLTRAELVAVGFELAAVEQPV